MQRIKYCAELSTKWGIYTALCPIPQAQRPLQRRGLRDLRAGEDCWETEFSGPKWGRCEIS